MAPDIVQVRFGSQVNGWTAAGSTNSKSAMAQTNLAVPKTRVVSFYLKAKLAAFAVRVEFVTAFKVR